MRLLPGSNALEKMSKIKSELQRRIQVPKMRGRKKPDKDKRRRGTLGKDHNQTNKNKRKRGINTNNRRIPRSSTKGHKRKRGNKNTAEPRGAI